MAVELTPTDKLFIMNLDQNEFDGFSYTNPEFVILVWGAVVSETFLRPVESSSISPKSRPLFAFKLHPRHRLDWAEPSNHSHSSIDDGASGQSWTNATTRS